MSDNKSKTVFVESAKCVGPVEGQLTIKSIDKRGNIYTYRTPNVIVHDARDTMAHLLVGDEVATRRLNKLAVGTSSTAAARDNSALGAQVFITDFTSFSYPDTGQVEVVAILDFNDAVGQNLQEAGLFCEANNTLFARQVYGTINKTATIQLQFIWRIIFT